MAALARKILTDKVTPDLLREVEAGPERFDGDVWRALADADLLGIAIPEEAGGGGYGFVEQCLILEEVGRRVAPVPVLASIVCAALPIATFGSPAQKDAWVQAAVSGEKILSAALSESLNPDPGRPATTATPSGDGYVLNGTKTAVPTGTMADLFVVPAAVDGRVGVFLV